jgi:hypothetical protein
MLRITVELIPRGNEDLKKVIAVGEIANVSTLPGFTDEYVALYKEEPFHGVERGPYTCYLRGWPRTVKGVWELIHATASEALKNNANRRSRGKSITLNEAIENWLRDDDCRDSQ